jgi:hypothetical protein
VNHDQRFQAEKGRRHGPVLRGCHIVMEELDLIADCRLQQVHPRDPKGIVAELE